MGPKELLAILMLMILMAAAVTGCTGDSGDEDEDEEDDGDDGDGGDGDGGGDEAPPADAGIALEGRISAATLKLSDIVAATDPVTYVDAAKKEDVNNYTGVRLLDLLEDNGLFPDAGSVSVEAGDGYSKGFAVFDLWYRPDRLDEQPVILAWKMDGEWLGETEENATWMVVAPGYSSSYWIKDPAKLVVSTFGLEVGGTANVTVPMTDLMDPVQYTQVSFDTTEPSEGALSAKGVAISEILDEAGVPAGATTVRFTASDGYNLEMPLSEIQNNSESQYPIIAAYEMDGEPVYRSSGPLRVVAPDDDYADDDTNWFKQHWLKSLAKVEVY